jgi:hypothetical protein
LMSQRILRIMTRLLEMHYRRHGNVFQLLQDPVVLAPTTSRWFDTQFPVILNNDPSSLQDCCVRWLERDARRPDLIPEVFF